jgi:hypothetical protein
MHARLERRMDLSLEKMVMRSGMNNRAGIGLMNELKSGG